MTAIRISGEARTILDFSQGKCSKNKIRQALKTCRLSSLEDGTKGPVLYTNLIKVGLYTVDIQLPLDMEGPHRLKEFKDFEVHIYRGKDCINLKTDPCFKNQCWVDKNAFGQLRVKHLIDVVSHCKRLDKLKAFL
jgi:hypothetical protein